MANAGCVCPAGLQLQVQLVKTNKTSVSSLKMTGFQIKLNQKSDLVNQKLGVGSITTRLYLQRHKELMSQISCDKKMSLSLF